MSVMNDGVKESVLTSEHLRKNKTLTIRLSKSAFTFAASFS